MSHRSTCIEGFVPSKTLFRAEALGSDWIKKPQTSSMDKSFDGFIDEWAIGDGGNIRSGGLVGCSESREAWLEGCIYIAGPFF